IPVFHDDQHGTAIVVLAALRNALRVVGKKLSEVRITLAGAGAAGTAILKLLMHAGAENIIVSDVHGAIHKNREDVDDNVSWIAECSTSSGYSGDLKGAVVGVVVFIGVSATNLIRCDDIDEMNENSVIFALVNAEPHIDPDIA